jgi:hypothetical protein
MRTMLGALQFAIWNIAIKESRTWGGLISAIPSYMAVGIGRFWGGEDIGGPDEKDLSGKAAPDACDSERAGGKLSASGTTRMLRRVSRA